MKNKNLIYIVAGVGVIGFLYMRSKKPKQVLKKTDVQEDDFGKGGGGGYTSGTMSAPISTTTPNITINNSGSSPIGATSVSPSSSIAPEISLPPRTSTTPTAIRPNVTEAMPLPSATLPLRTNFLGFDGDMTNKTRRFDFSTDF